MKSIFRIALLAIPILLWAQDASDWDDIHFDSGSSIVVDGLATLNRLANVLGRADVRVELTGYADALESPAAAQKLSQARADAVKAYLVARGVNAEQIVARGEGTSAPLADNRTKEGRFQNRRVSIAVRGAQGNVIREGAVNDLAGQLNKLQDEARMQQDAYNQVLKRLDKLDDLLAADKQLQGETDQLKAQMADLRNQNSQLKNQLDGIPKPLTETQMQNAVVSALGSARGVAETPLWTGGVTGRAFLIGKKAEDPGYGLYSYILIPRKPAASEKDLKKKYMAVIEAYQASIDTLKELANQRNPPKPPQINLTYLPLQFLPDKITSEKLLEASNSAAADTMIRLLAAIPVHKDVDKREGPFIVSYRAPLSAAERIEGRHLFIDMSHVPADVVTLYVNAFRVQSSRENFWEDDRFILDCYAYIENAGEEFSRVAKQFKDKTLLTTIFNWFK